MTYINQINRGILRCLMTDYGRPTYFYDLMTASLSASNLGHYIISRGSSVEQLEKQ